MRRFLCESPRRCVALYEGDTIAGMKIIGATTDPDLVQRVEQRLLSASALNEPEADSRRGNNRDES